VVRILVLFGLASLMGACATITESSPVTVSPSSADGSQWAITGKAETGMLYDDVTLYVNGAVVAEGRLGPNASDHRDVHIAGDYQHHIVLGICSRTDSDPITYTCDMFVDGTAAGTLRW